MVIELLAYTMRQDCGGIAAGEMRGERNGECDYIRFDFFHVGHLRLLQRTRSVV